MRLVVITILTILILAGLGTWGAPPFFRQWYFDFWTTEGMSLRDWSVFYTVMVGVVCMVGGFIGGLLCCYVLITTAWKNEPLRGDVRVNHAEEEYRMIKNLNAKIQVLQESTKRKKKRLAALVAENEEFEAKQKTKS